MASSGPPSSRSSGLYGPATAAHGPALPPPLSSAVCCGACAAHTLRCPMPYSARYPQGQVFDPAADDPAMVEAIVWLSRERIAFARVSVHQLKIGRTLSFYPVKGTIMYDRQKPLPQRG